jgi:hypothetical protein
MMPSRTVPPDPHRFLSFVASASISESDSGKPVMVVTPLPALPLISRATRTAEGLAAPGTPFGHTHSRTGRRQFGQRLPWPVEYMTREFIYNRNGVGPAIQVSGMPDLRLESAVSKAPVHAIP